MISPDGNTAQAAERQFATTNKWEDCKQVCREVDVVLDCGANVGQTARNLRQAYPNAEIYSFEPVTAPFVELQKIAGSLAIHPVQSAVADFNGEAEINLTVSNESHSMLGYLQGENPLAAYHQEVGKERINVCRLDDWCRGNGIDTERIGVLKMDVQGMELAALRGATEILRTVPIILLEIAFVPVYAECPLVDEVESYLAEHGFVRSALYPSIMPDLWADGMYIVASS